nr:MAG TPA: hypothetical protein [Caudoviricetes sp.]
MKQNLFINAADYHILQASSNSQGYFSIRCRTGTLVSLYPKLSNVKVHINYIFKYIFRPMT